MRKNKENLKSAAYIKIPATVVTYVETKSDFNDNDRLFKTVYQFELNGEKQQYVTQWAVSGNMLDKKGSIVTLYYDQGAACIVEQDPMDRPFDNGMHDTDVFVLLGIMMMVISFFDNFIISL
jgi:hypothetical protein